MRKKEMSGLPEEGGPLAKPAAASGAAALNTAQMANIAAAVFGPSVQAMRDAVAEIAFQGRAAQTKMRVAHLLHLPPRPPPRARTRREQRPPGSSVL